MSDEQSKVEDESKESSKKGFRKGRKPQRSSRIETTDFDEVDNPSVQYSLPGSPPRSRYDKVLDSGALDGIIGTNVFRKEIEDLQNEQNAFVAWQAKQKEYIIYQNVEYDEEKGQDKWVGVPYEYYPLTMGQRLRLQKLEAEVADLTRAIQNNDRTVTNANQRLYEKNIDLTKEQCALYLRMDVDKEFEISNYSDVTLAISAARYAELHVPLHQVKRSQISSSAKKSTGVA